MTAGDGDEEPVRDWVNNGSYQDLSGMPLARSSLWPTSQAGGNMTSSSQDAMTAPGSEPVDPLPDRAEQGDPAVRLPPPVPPGTSGKPQASGQAGPQAARHPAWGRPATPGVTRETTPPAPRRGS